MRSFLRDERGANLVEYSLLATFISIVAVLALSLISPKVKDLYDDINTQLGLMP